jgi:methionyl-tRNA formyltransferase
VPILDALAAAGRAPALVVTQPARPAGRGRTVRQGAAAQWALEAGIELWQPERATDPALLGRLSELAPRWGVVAAYGEILRPALLSVAERGFLNVHASLLPAWRGASPIQAALAAGETVTGVTIMQMDEGLDTGPIVLQRELRIDPEETAPELSERLARLGGEALVAALDACEAGRLAPVPQDPARATWAPRLRRSDGDVDWSLPAKALQDRWRAYQPWPGIRAPIAGERVALGSARVAATSAEAPPGVLLALDSGRITVACGEASALEIETLQRPGRRLLPAAEVVRGLRLEPGERLDARSP